MVGGADHHVGGHHHHLDEDVGGAHGGQLGEGDALLRLVREGDDGGE